MEKFIFSLAIIFGGLLIGYTYQILVRNQKIKSRIPTQTVRKAMQKAAFLFFNPIAFLGAVWIVRLDNLKVIMMPFIGITALALGGVLAYVFSRLMKLPRKQTGAYIVSGGFTNIGSIGGLICFTLLGEAGYALVSFYSLFEMIGYYGVGFPLAKAFSENPGESIKTKNRFKNLFADPFVFVALGSGLLGLIFNITGLPRPDFYAGISAAFVPIGTFLLVSSIGMAMRFSRIRLFLKEGLLMALIKFVLVPVTATTLAYFLGFGEIDQGLPLKVVLILSSMPVAFTALVPPTIYDLDVDLANTTWLVTNLSLWLVVPVLSLLV